MDHGSDDRRESAGAGVPWAGVVVTVMSVIAMAAIGWAAWDSLPEVVTTRPATPARHGVTVPRLVFVTALPMALAFVGVVVAGGTALADRVFPRTPLSPRGPVPARVMVWPRGALWLMTPPSVRAGTLNVLFVALPLFLVVLQAGVLLRAAGHDLPLDTVVAVAFGLLLVALGGRLARIGPWYGSAGERRSRRVAAALMTAVGVACAAGAPLFPPLVVAAASAVLFPAIHAAFVLRGVTKAR
ncbi:hypothetical protein HTZ77_35715 [Nonomuraea sp. SMC257]|uniref:DUF1648 domain-containing protein n=1 Tax=Nonomuraea montanisoli TaxID=2741721 RepID=A0A7Y6IEC6_9ACTN|nr:hypothetical protein [Nonomuraea montanisoli]NUW36717.1 hypothetical protein [Nonomuraea montanisoli]